MASKTVFQEINPTALQHFGLANTLVKGVFASDCVEPVIITQSELTYTQIKDLLNVNTIQGANINTKKKAFILPLCPLSTDRIKASLKEHNITVTNDYELADLIITHDNFHSDLSHSEPILISKMMAKLYNYYTINSTNGKIKYIDEWIEKNNTTVILDEKLTQHIPYYNCNLGDSLFDHYMLSGMAINLAYKIVNDGVSVIDVDVVINESANKQLLTEDLIKDISRLIKSYSDEDTAMAAMIIPTIDYTKNLHLFWELANLLSNYTYKFNRNKDVQYWFDISEMRSISRMNAEEMIQHLESKNLLNNIYFKYFEPIARKEIVISNRDLYVFNVQVKPEYQKYLK